jgi:hypothetical protein
MAAIRRTLIIAGLLIAAGGLLWPWIAQLRLGHLPGDITVRWEHGSFHFPIVTCILLSLALSLVLRLIGR